MLPVVLVAYILYVTWTWEFPDWRGVPFPPVWAATVVAVVLAWRRLGPPLGIPLGAVQLAAVVTVTAMVLTDVTMLWTQGMRDLELYLKAGDRWLAGAPVYMSTPLAVRPEDLSNYPFLYPPLTLPLFGALAVLPIPIAVSIWTAGSLAAVIAGCRWVGLGWRWTLLILAWPPVAQGIYVGNVAVPMFALFAGAIWRPALLAGPPIFKIYSGLTGLWLLRREHWRSLAVGVAGVIALVAVTWPLTGLDLWRRWFDGLAAYQVSQRLLPEYLYGFGLARWLPLAAVAALAMVVTVLALRARGRREQLARLGVATVVGSPSLFSHGFLLALPAMVRLDTPWFWLALGLTACSPGLAWFGALGLVLASWFVPTLRRGRGADPWHPLGVASSPWPGAVTRRPGRELAGETGRRPGAVQTDHRRPAHGRTEARSS